MRINVYTEELINGGDKPMAEIVTAKYISSRTGLEMTNYGVRIFLHSAPELHYIPGRDDDRSAITFWCGDKEKNMLAFLDAVRQVINGDTLQIWREKTEKRQAETESAEAARK